MRKGLFRAVEGGNPNPAQGPISRPLPMLFLLPGVRFPRAFGRGAVQGRAGLPNQLGRV